MQQRVGLDLRDGELKVVAEVVARLRACKESNGGGVAWGVCGDAICGC